MHLNKIRILCLQKPDSVYESENRTISWDLFYHIRKDGQSKQTNILTSEGLFYHAFDWDPRLSTYASS